MGLLFYGPEDDHCLCGAKRGEHGDSGDIDTPHPFYFMCSGEEIGWY